MDQATATIFAAIVAAVASIATALVGRLKQSHAIALVGVFSLLAMGLVTLLYNHGGKQPDASQRWEGMWEQTAYGKVGELLGDRLPDATPHRRGI